MKRGLTGRAVGRRVPARPPGPDGADGWPWGPDETPRFRGHAVESRKVTTCPELRW